MVLLDFFFVPFKFRDGFSILSAFQEIFGSFCFVKALAMFLYLWVFNEFQQDYLNQSIVLLDIRQIHFISHFISFQTRFINCLKRLCNITRHFVKTPIYLEKNRYFNQIIRFPLQNSGLILFVFSNKRQIPELSFSLFCVPFLVCLILSTKFQKKFESVS